MPDYYFLRNELPETLEIDPGYESGIIDKFNPAPKGATIVSSIERLEELQKKYDAFEPQDIDEQNGGGIPDECPVTIPSDVRWHQPENGEPLWYSFRSDLSARDRQWVRRCWAEFSDWAEKDTNIVFRFVSRPASADIVIGIRDIDGAGRVLAEAVTRVITRRDRIVSGEIFFDSADILNVTRRTATHLHEGCHVIGIPHSPGDTGLMAARANSVTDFGEYENAEKFKRYPKQKYGAAALSNRTDKV